MTDAERKKPHESLSGMELDGGWKVLSGAAKSTAATGGHFSCGYIVQNADGRSGYLKALDFFSMLPDSPDPARDLEPLIRAFNFERDVLETCRRGKLSRIVTALGSGSVTVRGFPPPATVQYIIFELADGDVRGLMATAATFDAALVMRTLHHVATGLRQLHGIGVAHRDLKPSNVLRFEAIRSSKLGDLGRAAVRGSEPPHYGAMPAGDWGYAPPEALYDGPMGSWETRRMGCDAYHLGSMICSLVTTVGMSPLMMMSLHPSHRWQSWKGSFEEALVFLRPAFIDAVEYVAAELPSEIREDVVTVLKQLCEPDPMKRGHPLERRIEGGNTFALERYVAKFDLLASRAELAAGRAGWLMSFADGRRRRQVVPRWRPWWVTARLGLADARESVRDVARPDTRTIDQRLEDWAQNPDVFHAGDLISTAFGMGCGDRARDVAEAVLKSDRRVPEPLRLMAERIVNGERPLPSAPLELDAGQRHARIHKLKTRLRAWPNDALTQMDLAREYTILGQRPKAVRPVTTALALAPRSPFVVRSAARFFLNDGDHDRALRVVRRAPNVSGDPWLLAAEVAISDATGRATRFARAAKALLGRGAFSPKHLSELACALATIELESGNRRMARKLFSAGLQSPTENAAAQAEWAFSEIDNLDLAAQVPPERSYEAEAMSQLGHGNWSFAIENARLWGLDEPFSARAAYFGSWTASVVGNDAVLALQFANLGLSTKPKDKLLLNNKAVALALPGRPADAQRAFQQISMADSKDGMEATYLATQGMIDYRLGHAALGRALYEKAREISRKQKNTREEAWSLLFQAREERRFDSSAADRLLSEAREKVNALRAREATVAARLLEIVATSD